MRRGADGLLEQAPEMGDADTCPVSQCRYREVVPEVAVNMVEYRLQAREVHVPGVETRGFRGCQYPVYLLEHDRYQGGHETLVTRGPLVQLGHQLAHQGADQGVAELQRPGRLVSQ